MFGFQEILVIGLLCLLIFGPNKLPEMARDFGKFISQVRSSVDDFKSELNFADEEQDSSEDTDEDWWTEEEEVGDEEAEDDEEFEDDFDSVKDPDEEDEEEDESAPNSQNQKQTRQPEDGTVNQASSEVISKS